MNKLQKLRKKYPKFVYENFSYGLSNNDLKIVFSFCIKPDIFFRPEVTIKNVDHRRLKEIGKESLDNLIFHLGLIEIPSYWKTTCSPMIEIKAGFLNKKQIGWWKSLLLEGMGQFYYENKIDWRESAFLKIYSLCDKKILRPYSGKLKNRYLVPFAGGRDSIVTLEKLKKLHKEISLFTVNPITKIQRAAKVSGIKNQVIIKREIDKKLFDLNKKEYLNGHTPFTSFLSFLSVLCAIIFDYKSIAFSNEKSADEGNVKYLGKIINHQWAKSSNFEKKFRDYSKKYLSREINYFSFLRKRTELEVSKIFIKYPQYFSVFSSCNAGMKISARGLLRSKKRWCGNCPKCLFVYLTLYPFLEESKLIKIFGKNIFEDRKLFPLMMDLLGKGRKKPFECVGTYRETKEAVSLAMKKCGKNPPYLLRNVR